MRLQTLMVHLPRCQSALRGAGLIAPLIVGMALAQPVLAGCLDVPGIKLPTDRSGDPAALGSVRFIKVDFRDTGEDRHQSEESETRAAPIVGLWAFKYISEGNMSTLGIPDGAVVDGGNTTWFADGNEMTYSGMRNPIVGATCLGVWKRTGEHSYVLNHVGLSWNPLAASTSPPNAPAPAGPDNPGGGPGAPAGPAFIKQYVVLAADRQSYTGSFSINQLLPDGKTPALPVPIKGKIVARRIGIDTATLEP